MKNEADREKHNAYMREWNARQSPEMKASMAEYQKTYREGRKEEFAAKDRAYYLANREKILARVKARYEANPEPVKAYVTAWAKAMPPEKRAEYRATARASAAKPETKASKKAYGRKRYEENRETILAKGREHHRLAGEARLAQKRAWAAAHRHLGAHYAAKRRALMFKATPAWADLGAIEQEYAAAALRSEAEGVVYEVDHIVPLNSKLVCGLHVPANLRVVPRLTNRSKGNRHWPDMP